jgi:hypothetical protein
MARAMPPHGSSKQHSFVSFLVSFACEDDEQCAVDCSCDDEDAMQCAVIVSPVPLILCHLV